MPSGRVRKPQGFGTTGRAHVPELGTRVNDPDVQGPLPEPFLQHRLLATVYLHGQPVRGRLEDGPQRGHDRSRAGRTAVAAFLARRGQAVSARVRGCGTAARKARVLWEARIRRGLHGGTRRRRRRRRKQ